MYRSEKLGRVAYVFYDVFSRICEVDEGIPGLCVDERDEILVAMRRSRFNGRADIRGERCCYGVSVFGLGVWFRASFAVGAP